MDSLVITQWDCISHFGIGKEHFLNGLEKQRIEPVSATETDPTPIKKIQGFDIKKQLGKKGTRNLDRLTGLSISAVSRVINSMENYEEQDKERIGLVLGSSCGSMDSIVRFTSESYKDKDTGFVNPALFVNTVMNCAASQTAIWHKNKGPNATVSNGELSSLSALKYSTNILHRGYADTVLVGGAEEISEISEAANQICTSSASKPLAPYTEGSIYFVMEKQSIAKKYRRKPLAEVVTIKLRNGLKFNGISEKDKIDQLSEFLYDSLVKHEIPTTEVESLSICQTTPALSHIEEAAVSQVFKNHLPHQIGRLSQFLGNGISINNAFQLAWLMCKMTDQPPNKYGLLLSVDTHGRMGVLAIKGMAH